LNNWLFEELAEDGYGGVEVIWKQTKQLDVIIRAKRTKNVLGEKGRRIRELTMAIIDRFHFDDRSVSVYAEAIQSPPLSALCQALSLKYKILCGLEVKRAGEGVLRFIENGGADGCEIIISGKLKGQRAKAMKFKFGNMIHSGNDKTFYIDKSVQQCCLRSGVIGIQIRILLRFQQTGIGGPKIHRSDVVKVLPPKEPPPMPRSFTYTQFAPLPPGWTPPKKSNVVTTKTIKSKKQKKKNSSSLSAKTTIPVS